VLVPCRPFLPSEMFVSEARVNPRVEHGATLLGGLRPYSQI
jgi:hypothetical protein